MPELPETPKLNVLSRRSFLDWILGICGSIFAIAATIPALIYLLPVTRKGSGSGKKQVKGATDLAPWESITDVVSGKPVILLRTDKGFLAFSAACTHLGCIVHWDKGQKAFICPCHAATFDSDGEVLDGPPPTPLRPYKVAETVDSVFVSET